MDGVADRETSVADRLYAVPPRQFVAERDAAVAAARAAGDAETAAALAALRRPTVTAWLVNMLALRAPERLAELGELADLLRQAQQELDGERLRELTAGRRTTVSGLVEAARSLASEADPELAGGKLPLAEVEAMLQAALADPEVATAIRSGRLTKPVAASGFGELPRPKLRLVTGDATDEPATAGAEQLTMPVAQAQLAEAQAAAATAAAELERATAAERDARQELTDIEAAEAELAARRAAALQQLAATAAEALAARRAVAASRRRVGEVEATIAALTD